MRKIFIVLMGLMLLTSTAFGAVAINEDGDYIGEATTIDMPEGWVDSYDGSTVFIDCGEGTVEFLLSDFLLRSDVHF